MAKKQKSGKTPVPSMEELKQSAVDVLTEVLNSREKEVTLRFTAADCFDIVPKGTVMHGSELEDTDITVVLNKDGFTCTVENCSEYSDYDDDEEDDEEMKEPLNKLTFSQIAFILSHI